MAPAPFCLADQTGNNAQRPPAAIRAATPTIPAAASLPSHLRTATVVLLVLRQRCTRNHWAELRETCIPRRVLPFRGQDDCRNQPPLVSPSQPRVHQKLGAGQPRHSQASLLCDHELSRSKPCAMINRRLSPTPLDLGRRQNSDEYAVRNPVQPQSTRATSDSYTGSSSEG